MKRLCLALAVVALLLFVTGVGTATAAPPVVQDSGQLAGSDQDAGAAAGTAQQEPSNSNTSVRVLSPGDEGDVSQTNEASSDATATNLNATEQTADQTQSGGGLQVIGQSAKNDQDAFALALTVQEGASNQNAPVRVLSENEGDGGDVTQENIASSDAEAGNANVTDQTADQTQSGGDCKCGSDGTQLIGQEADNDQKAAALAATKQEKPSNTNISVRVLSPGDDGDVSQTNEATSDATAGNLNATEQTATQEQSGDCKCSGGDQAIAQSADSDQKAAALAATKQEKPSNKNISIRVLSDGDNGDVTQVNKATSDATAGNLNVTKQDADQTQAGGSGSQTIAQSADNDQEALAGALTVQEKPSNTNISVRVLSPGDGGKVTQKNIASSNATAGNLNVTKQDAEQTQTGDACKCKHGGEQLIAQSAKNDQDAVALSATIQEKPSNTNTPIRVLSKGDDGDVEQKNDASSNADAVNLNGTHQTATQSQGGGSGSQIIGQESKNDQDAFALGLTFQHGASNENAPVRVLSKGDDGDVEQENEASSNATAANLNTTEQTGTQTQTGDSCKCKSGGEQIIAQSAKNDQEAAALAATFQVKPSNENSPVRVLSKGDSGKVDQDNEASSNATAGNLNATKQTATQEQADDACKCKHGGTQLIAQHAESDQDAAAIAATFQVKPSNTNEPIRVLSKGDDGDVEQENEASSNAEAGNLNLTKQTATQAQSGPGLQVIAQSAKNEQDAFALGLTFQVGASNENAPVRVLSKGDSGDVTQVNKATSDATAGNFNWTDQTAAQTQGGPGTKGCCGTGIQAVGQLAKNEQGAVALSLTAQLGAKQPCVCGEKGSIGNSNEPTRVSSPGDDGDVDQENKATSSALATNWNVAKQHVQEIQAAPCLCKDDGIQAVGQLDESNQFALAAAAGLQLDPKNASKPDRKESPGYKGGLSQFGKKNVHDASGNESMSDQSKRKIQRW